MPSRTEVSYFGAGPAPLPTEVLEKASNALLNYKDSGIGLAEISHRSSDANEILANAKQAITALLDVPEDYEILFMQAGGSGEFSAVVYNMIASWVQSFKSEFEKKRGVNLNEIDTASSTFEEFKNLALNHLRLDYLVTGSWSLKAFQEASRLVGKEFVNLAVDARQYNDGKFGVIPNESEWKLSQLGENSEFATLKSPALTYFCDNETVDGVEFPSFPSKLANNETNIDRHIVADMSSNFLSRRVDVSKYSVIFGGAQKNIGSAGITIVLVHKSLVSSDSTASLPSILRKLNLPIGPVVLDYATITKNNSLYNTLPIFDLWIAGEVMSGMAKKYGAEKVAGQEKISVEKAKRIYSALDSNNAVYHVVPSGSARSRMNICLRIKNGEEQAETAFVKEAGARNLSGLKGHRSVGGIRISNYNAVSMDSVDKLVEFLNTFAKNQSQPNGV